ncbi:MAG: ribosomal protein S18-alanine N-acetyltransferase [Candidatus Aminicenantes bacterium]|nr:ribosomal protein S18-alanine N-acetyltransferase [Candidatus Aminicenantes bacterium]
MRNRISRNRRKKIEIKLRKARIDDIEAINRIEQAQFSNPWKKHYFSAELFHDISYFYTAEDSGKILGYIIFWLIEETIELHNIAVHEDYTRRGIGSKMMDFLLEIAARKRVGEIFLEVRKSNRAAEKFYKKYRFEKIDCRKNYFNSPNEDALVYALYLKF